MKAALQEQLRVWIPQVLQEQQLEQEEVELPFSAGETISGHPFNQIVWGLYLDIPILYHSPVLALFQGIFITMRSQHFTTNIRQDVQILKDSRLQAVDMNRRYRFKRSLSFCKSKSEKLFQ